MTVRNVKNIFVLTLTLIIGFSAHSYAETKIAVVDVDTILMTSKAAQSIKVQVDTKRKNFLAAVKKEEDKLRADQKAIEAKRSEMSKEELVKKAQEFEKQRIEARNTLKKKKATLDKSYSKAMGTLTKAISTACQELANERKIDLIITRQTIIVGSNSLDITKDVMELINKRFPELTLE